MVSNYAFVSDKANGPFCRTIVISVWMLGFALSLAIDGLLVTIAPFDAALNRVVPTPLLIKMISLNHYTGFVRHPRTRKEVGKDVQVVLYETHMNRDIYNVVADCTTRRNHLEHEPHHVYLKLFTATGPLDFIVISILSPLRKTRTGLIISP